MKKFLSVLMAAALCISTLTGCTSFSRLDPHDPVALTMWHVYGEQADSPMNRLVDEFNRTVGREKGIVINVTMMSNSTQIGEKLKEAQANTLGAGQMPDLFFCHVNNAAELGAENLLDWNDCFSSRELDAFVPDFVEDGKIGNALVVLPVSKSTHLLFVNGTRYRAFTQDCGTELSALSSWDGFFRTAQQYYEWSGGTPLCAMDFPIRNVEFIAMENGASPEEFMSEDGWYNFENETFFAAWMEFARSLVKGHIIVSDRFSNTQVMTGEVGAGMGSCAAILYYNDTVTYPDNTSEPLDLQLLPIPQVRDAQPLATQAGVGLCACKTTPQKAEAAEIFARWLTEGERNLNFVEQAGYMPVTKDAFDAISSEHFEDEADRRLYTTLQSVIETHKMVRENDAAGYYAKINTLYESLRTMQSQWSERYRSGEDPEALAMESWELFRAIR